MSDTPFLAPIYHMGMPCHAVAFYVYGEYRGLYVVHTLADDPQNLYRVWPCDPLADQGFTPLGSHGHHTHPLTGPSRDVLFSTGTLGVEQLPIGGHRLEFELIQDEHTWRYTMLEFELPRLYREYERAIVSCERFFTGDEYVDEAREARADRMAFRLICAAGYFGDYRILRFEGAEIDFADMMLRGARHAEFVSQESEQGIAQSERFYEMQDLLLQGGSDE